MTLNADSLPNVLRLQSLKNVSGRRKVLPGAQFLEDLENYESDVSGIAPPSAPAPTGLNLPEPEMGGELTPQSYDIRANSVQAPEEQGMTAEEPGFWSHVGKALADYISPQKRAEMSEKNQAMLSKARGMEAAPQVPPIETAQVQEQEGLPPVTASEQAYKGPQMPEQSPGVWGAIADYFSPTKRAEMGQYTSDLMTDAQLKAQGKNPAEVRGRVHEQYAQDVEKAMEQPWQYAAYGSAEQVATHPALQEQFREITGIDFEPQIAAQVSQYEEAMKAVEDSLNGEQTALGEREEGIKQRILSNQSTDADKFYIGLALLLPLIVGGFFGKEAALGALGGTAKGMAEVYGKREKGLREDEQTLMDIAKQKASNIEKLAGINLEKAKLRPSLEKNLPEQPEKHLMGLEEVRWVNPETGKEERAVEILPGMVAHGKYVATPERYKMMEKAAMELAPVKTYADDVNDLTNDVLEIVSQLKDKNVFSKMFTAIASGTTPGALSKITQDVVIDGRPVNAGVALEQKLGFLANKYGMAQQLGQLDRAAQNHIKKIMDNPTATLLTPQDAINQMLEVRKLVQNSVLSDLKNKGFIPDFTQKNFEEKNTALFSRLNQDEQSKRLEQIKREALKNETNYAQ